MVIDKLNGFAHCPAGDFHLKIWLIEQIPDQGFGHESGSQDKNFFHDDNSLHKFI
jgi:hypothetical protein